VEGTKTSFIMKRFDWRGSAHQAINTYFSCWQHMGMCL